MPKSPEYDVSSAEPVLFHVSGEAFGIPAADLSANVLARIAWIRLGPDRPSSPADVPQRAIAAVRDELVATGKYALKPVTPATEVPTDE